MNDIADFLTMLKLGCYRTPTRHGCCCSYCLACRCPHQHMVFKSLKMDGLATGLCIRLSQLTQDGENYLAVLDKLNTPQYEDLPF